MAQPRNILLVQLGDIGDVVLTTPTIRAVKEEYPHARVSILVRKPFGGLLAADPHLYEVVESEKVRGNLFYVVRKYARFACRLRKARYDLVIDLRTGDRGAIFSFLTGAKERIGRPGDKNQFWRTLLFTKIGRNPPAALPPVHPGADQSLRIVRDLGITTGDSTPKLYLGPKDRESAAALLAEYGLTVGKHWATVNPFARWKYKEWESVKWGEVIDWLWETHRLPTVLVGSSEQHSANSEIAARREAYTINLAGQTTLGELAAVLSRSSLHLGVDSAASHIAEAVGTPTVTVHGPSDWRAWRISNELNRIVTPEIECVPCNRRGCDDSQISRCLNQLTSEEVIRVVEEVLQKRDGDHSQTAKDATSLAQL